MLVCVTGQLVPEFPSAGEDDILTEELVRGEKLFLAACEQIRYIDGEIEQQQRRLQQAISRKLPSFQYVLDMKIAILEGTRNMYVEYAASTADRVKMLQTYLYGDSDISDSDDDDDEWAGPETEL